MSDYSGGNSFFAFRPEFFPPPGAVLVNKADFLTSAGGAASTDIPPGLVFNVPEGRTLVIRSFNEFINAMTTLTRVAWRLRANGIPLAGLEAIILIPRNADFVTAGDDIVVVVEGPARVDVAIVNTDGAAYIYGASYNGWHYSTNYRPPSPEEQLAPFADRLARVIAAAVGRK
jgi:hypothetical protein